ncbi:MAG: hypothetical protein LBL06_02435 [Treponema sp.]|nr:hypothetical protein [Treponema sp.]
MADCIPMREIDLLRWALNFATLCLANQDLWGLPPTEVATLNAAVAEFDNIYRTALGPNASKADILLKNEKKKALKVLLRDFKNRNIDPNRAVTDPNRERLGLTIRDIKNTPVPPPTTVPEFEFTYPGARRIDVHFRDFGSKRKAKPKGAAGAVILYSVRATPPVNQDELAHSVFTSRTPYHFEFKEEERGKMVYVALFWQNRKGDRGPWSEIQPVIIP